MKKIIVLFAFSAILFNLSAQQHYVWPGESTTRCYGRIIEMIEVSPGNVAYQSLLFNQQWGQENMLLETIDLNNGNTVFVDTMSKQDQWYRAGFGKLSDHSVVVSCYSKLGYQIAHYRYDKTSPGLKRGSTHMTMESSFGAGSGGICPLKNGGYAVAFMYQDNPNSRNDCRILLLNDESKFNSPPFDYLKTTSDNIIMKPYLIDPMYNHHYTMSEGNFGSLIDQVVESPDGNILVFNGTLDSQNNSEPRMWSFNNKMELQWETKVVGGGYGYRPLAAGKANVSYLTMFTITKQGYTQTNINCYIKDKKQDQLICSIDSFEANGSFVMADENLCVYGFSTHFNSETGDYSDKHPAWYILDGKTLKIISTWELSANDKPAKDVSAVIGATTNVPGKLYTGMQLADGSLVFGGHIMAIVLHPASQKQHGIFCNYMVKFTPKEWGKK